MFDLTAVDQELRTAARFLPKGYALHRGLTVPRALMNVVGWMGRLKGVEVAAVNGDVSVRIHRPHHTESGAAMLWIHGGGTVTGNAAQEDTFCRRLANSTGVTLVAVDHRLAPEHPYPIPLEDCYAALIWMIRQPWADPDTVAIGGASAGGGLSAAVSQLALDRGDVSPALQMLAYPMLDDRTGATPDGRTRVMWSERDNQQAWHWYLNGADPQIVAPARREDLTGLPPAWIGVGTLDRYYDESLTYADRLRAAGVPTHVEIAEGAFHVFDLMVPKAAVSQHFFASQCRALRGALTPDAS
jgi:acetyl esterase/lipase